MVLILTNQKASGIMTKIIHNRQMKISKTNLAKTANGKGNLRMDLFGLIGAQRRTAQTTGKTQNASGSSFNSALQRANASAMPQDSIQISAFNYPKALEALRKEHENTDYSQMTPMEQDKLITERFANTFPDYWAARGGLYRPTQDTYYQVILDESWNQIQSAQAQTELVDPQPFQGAISYGYEGTKSEIRQQILAEFPGSSMLDRANALGKIMSVGGIGSEAEYYMMEELRNQLHTLLKAHSPGIPAHSPGYLSQVTTIASENQISWSDLKSAAIRNLSAAISQSSGDHANEQKKQDYMNDLRKELDAFMQDAMNVK